MRAGLAKWLSLGLAAVLLVAIAAAVLLYWRLQQGPMRLPLLEPHVRTALDDAMRSTGLRVDFRDVVLEIDRARGMPTLRLRQLSLRNASSGRELASAPRAAIALGGSDLLKGRLRVRHLELVGPRLLIWRDAAGNWNLGMGQGDAGGRSSAQEVSETPERGARQRAAGKTSTGVLAQLREALLRGGQGKKAIGGLRSLSISGARIDYRDDVLGLRWRMPEATLQLRRVPYGFALLGKTRLLGLGREMPLVISAAWRREDRQVNVSLQVQDAELAGILRELWGGQVRLEGVHLPFTARLGLDLDFTGNLLKASAEVLLSAGRAELPAWLASPVVVRDGALNLVYRPRTGEIAITRGELRLASGQARLSGSLHVLPGKGTLPRLGVDVALRHVPQSGAGRSVLDSVSLKGMLHLQPQQLDIDDLQLRGDGGALRLRGIVRRENDAAGIYVSGVARRISHRLLKALWPPKIGIGARQWLQENVVAGVIPDATLRLAIPGKVLKAAVEDDVPMPDKVADVRFKVAGVRFSYVDGWPRVVDAAGSGRMTGNHFRLVLDRGYSRLPSGKTLKLLRGEIRARDLAAKISPGRIEVQASGRASGFRELIDMPPLRLLRELGITKGTVKGQVKVHARLALPFHRGMTGKDVKVERVVADITQADAIGMVAAFDLKRGTFRVTYEKGVLQAEGDAYIDDLPVKLSWQRPVGDAAASRKSLLRLRARLTQQQQRKLGYDLSPWLNGPVKVDVQAPGDTWRIRHFRVRVGLDEMAVNLPAIGWRRPPRKGTSGSFDVVLDDKGGIHIRKLRLKGPGGLRVEGRLRLHANGRFRDATFARFELDANNRLALGLELERNRLNVVAAGPVFDARPLITRLFASRREIDRSLHSVFIRVNLQQVLALRGEVIENVRGEVEMRNGLVRRATLTGRFASGRKVALDLLPTRNGLRRLRIVSDDAGALLRASGLYSRVVGGEADFTALLKSGEDGGVQRGLLVMRRFTVRGDQRLTSLQQSRNKRAGPRRGQRFKKLVLPFSTDRHFIRIGDAIIRSPEIGATANGMIRRADGAMDIGGVIIPAYALNAAFGKIPLLGALLTGGRGQGVFGMTYALKGSMKQPKFLVNPLSAVAPGVFRQLFHLGGQNVNPDGTPRRRNADQPRRPRSRTNLANGG